MIEYVVLAASVVFVFVVVGGIGSMRLVQMLRSRRAPDRESLIDLYEREAVRIERRKRREKLESLIAGLFDDAKPEAAPQNRDADGSAV